MPSSVAERANFEYPWRRVDVYQDTWSALPADERDAVRLARLQALLNVARERTEFYRDCIPAQELTSLDALSSLPILTQKQYRLNAPPNGNGLVADPNASGFALASGGTLDAPKSCYRTVEAQHLNAVYLARGLAAAGFRKDDVVANLFAAGNLWVAFLSFTMALEHLDCRILPIGRAYTAEAAIKWMNEYGVTVLLGVPAGLARIAMEAPRTLPDPKIRLIATSGAPIFSATRRVLEERFGSPRFVSSGYASVDSGPMGFQCEHCTPSQYHLQEELHILEIVDPETHQPAPPGTVGSLIFTCLQSTVLPMIRYQIGDNGRWLDEERCPCGRVHRRYELSGRSNDARVGDEVSLLPEVISDAVGAVPGLSPDWQMRMYFEQEHEVVLLRCEALPDTSPESIDRERVKAEVRARNQRPEDVQGMYRLDVEVLPYGGLPRNPRTGKITMFIDERVREH